MPFLSRNTILSRKECLEPASLFLKPDFDLIKAEKKINQLVQLMENTLVQNDELIQFIVKEIQENPKKE